MRTAGVACNLEIGYRDARRRVGGDGNHAAAATRALTTAHVDWPKVSTLPSL
jgi:hypothetical protein